jgi:hypothetical protein
MTGVLVVVVVATIGILIVDVGIVTVVAKVVDEVIISLTIPRVEHEADINPIASINTK